MSYNSGVEELKKKKKNKKGGMRKGKEERGEEVIQ